MKKQQICILYDVNNNIGLGHKRRAQTLSKEFINQNIKIDLFELNAFRHELFNNYTDNIFIVDSPLVGPEQLTKMRKVGKVITLDYEGEGQVDLNVSVYDHNKPLTIGPRKTGFEFVMIREDSYFIIIFYIIS